MNVHVREEDLDIFREYGVFGFLCGKIADHTAPGDKVWSDGSMVLCKTAEMADNIADLIDAVYGDQVAVTGSYDPVEDAAAGTVDEYTGYHYVDIC